MNALTRYYSRMKGERLIKKARKRSKLLYDLCWSSTSTCADYLRALRLPVEAVKIQVGPLVVAHCLTMQIGGRAFASDDYPMFFNAMSDHTKTLLAASGIESINPVEAFPDDDLRRATIGTFYGPEVLNSWKAIVPPDSLFSMMLVLETLILSEELKRLHASYEGLVAVIRTRIVELTNNCPVLCSSAVLKQPMNDLCSKIMAGAEL